MYLYLIYLILNIISAISNPVPPRTVYDAILNSSRDPIYKCPYLRSSKLFESLAGVLKNCDNFTSAQTLQQLDETTVSTGLCILLYNSVEKLCYETNDYNSRTKFEQLLNLTHILDPQNIESVCSILVSNKSVVRNAKPGIDVITSALQKEGVCKRICTDGLSGRVKLVCSLSAYFINISKSLEHKEVKTAENLISQEATKISPPGPLKEIAIDAESGSSPPDGKSPIAREGLSTSLQAGDVPNKYKEPLLQDQDQQIPSNNMKLISNLNNSYMHRSNAPNSQFNKTTDKESETSNNSQIPVVNQKMREPKIVLNTNNNNKDSNLTSGANQVPFDVKVEPDINNVPGAKVLPIADPGSQHPHHLEVIDPNAAMAPHNSNNVKQEEKTPIKSPKSSPPKDSDKHTDHASKVVLSDNINVEDTPGDLEKNGEIPVNVNEDVPDDDIEIQGGMASVGDGEIDYPNDNAPPNAPKSSEVKAVEVAKSTEKLKPLETDDDRYSMSANYQNQNIDDSDSYFFSYFMMFCIIFICGYVAYHNKQKILALVVEGRKGRRPSRSKRPNSANYRKLDSNLEEAVTSTCNKQAPQVIY